MEYRSEPWSCEAESLPALFMCYAAIYGSQTLLFFSLSRYVRVTPLRIELQCIGGGIAWNCQPCHCTGLFRGLHFGPRQATNTNWRVSLHYHYRLLSAHRLLRTLSQRKLAGDGRHD